MFSQSVSNVTSEMFQFFLPIQDGIYQSGHGHYNGRIREIGPSELTKFAKSKVCASADGMQSHRFGQRRLATPRPTSNDNELGGW